MHHPDDDNRRAFARCEEQWLREPAWRTGEDEPEGTLYSSGLIAGASIIDLEAMRRVPLDLQIALELHYWEDMTTAELAEVLEIPQGTVKSRLRRGREALQAELARLTNDPALRDVALGGVETWAKEIRALVGGK